MTVMRLYTGDDGESHLEEIDPAINPGWLVLQQATGIMFRTTRAGFFEDYHNAPRRQYVISLSGEAEIGVADGTVFTSRPGDATLCEDLTGHGHTYRIIGDQPRVTAIIHLD